MNHPVRIPEWRSQNTKFGNKWTVCTHNHNHQSKREAQRCDELHLLQSGREIGSLRVQVRKELIPKQVGERACTFTCDFVYVRLGEEVWEDTKGEVTPQYVIKRKLMLWLHGIRVMEV